MFDIDGIDGIDGMGGTLILGKQSIFPSMELVALASAHTLEPSPSLHFLNLKNNSNANPTSLYIP